MSTEPPTPYTELLQLIQDMPTLVHEKRRRLGLSLRSATVVCGIDQASLRRLEAGQGISAKHMVQALEWLAEP